MKSAAARRRKRRTLSFEDLRGLKAECYIRDSTLDQRDGYGPEMQRKAMESFAHCYGLLMGSAYYTDFITGTSTLKRSGFQQALSDARSDRFDCLLVHHTSRFARNRADAIRYKTELADLGKIVVFVSQGIISGREGDFVNEGVNELLDEQYSRNVSLWVADGLKLKHDQGIANGVPPLGYKSEKLENGKRERKVPDLSGIGGDPKAGGMAALLALLRGYADGSHSYLTLASDLNSQGFRNRMGEPFTKGSIDHVLSNRFYEGKAVYHPGEADEEVVDGEHEVPEEVKELWRQCQEVKRHRESRHVSAGRPRSARRSYPFSRVSVCDECGISYSGQPVHTHSGRVIRRLNHGRPFCSVMPHSTRVENLEDQFAERILPYMRLDGELRAAVMQAATKPEESSSEQAEKLRLERALGNLRKQHLWSDIDDQEYRKEKQAIERQLLTLSSRQARGEAPDFDSMDRLLSSFETLWKHPGVTEDQREALVEELFTEVRLRGRSIAAVRPRPKYQLLFVVSVLEVVRKSRGERI